ncbi:MAG: nitroreductase family protein [Clostridiaceae bacterium]|jgi:nitroreductase|nr:nitroreductase family protein [Bacillota bacterium]NLN52258.1 nitroreductase family protein [Clostridiaceae bacterium]
MKTLTAIKQRSSCRNFSTKQITEQELEQLINAALAAPTARNLQDLKINVIQDNQLIQDISDESFRLMDEEILERMKSRNAQSLFYGAPTVFILSSPYTSFSNQNAGLATQNIALAAEAIGLSSCIIGLVAPAFAEDNPQNLKNRLSMTDDERFCLAIAVGYANSEKEPHQLNQNQIRIFD